MKKTNSIQFDFFTKQDVKIYLDKKLKYIK